MTDAESRIVSAEKAVLEKTISELQGKLSKQKKEMTDNRESCDKVLAQAKAEVAKLNAEDQVPLTKAIEELQPKA